MSYSIAQGPVRFNTLQYIIMEKNTKKNIFVCVCV